MAQKPENKSVKRPHYSTYSISANDGDGDLDRLCNQMHEDGYEIAHVIPPGRPSEGGDMPRLVFRLRSQP